MWVVEHSDPQRMTAYNLSSPSTRVQGARSRCIFSLAFIHGSQTEKGYISEGNSSPHKLLATLAAASLFEPSLAVVLYVTKWHHTVRHPQG